MTEPQEKQFKLISYEEMLAKQHELQNKNSIKNEKKAEKACKEYLHAADEDNVDLFTYTEAELDRHLAKFWFAASTQKGEHYRVSSLDNIRHSINRALKRMAMLLTLPNLNV